MFYLLLVLSFIIAASLFLYFKRFCDWVPIIQQEKNKVLLQMYPLDVWNGYVTKQQALKIFDQGTQEGLSSHKNGRGVGIRCHD
jgi:hypothetical protein